MSTTQPLYGLETAQRWAVEGAAEDGRPWLVYVIRDTEPAEYGACPVAKWVANESRYARRLTVVEVQEAAS